MQTLKAENAFEDNFSQAVMFEADFSQANFAVSAPTVEESKENQPEAIQSPDDIVVSLTEDKPELKATTDDGFNVPAVPYEKVSSQTY